MYKLVGQEEIFSGHTVKYTIVRSLSLLRALSLRDVYMTKDAVKVSKELSIFQGSNKYNQIFFKTPVSEGDYRVEYESKEDIINNNTYFSNNPVFASTIMSGWAEYWEDLF